jgi:hypothetical protein
MHSAMEGLKPSKGAIAFYNNIVLEQKDLEVLKKGELVYFFFKGNGDLETFDFFTEKCREEIYTLYQGSAWDKPIYDLGNLKSGNTLSDSLVLLEEVIEILYVEHGVLPLVIGGGDQAAMVMYRVLSRHNKALTVIDCSSKLPDFFGGVHFLSQILHAQNNALYHYIQLGYQQYLNSPDEIKRMNELLFESIRLGEVQGSLLNMEPKFRNAHYASISLDVMRSSEMVPSKAIRPNGMFSFELCQLLWFCAFSDSLKVGHIRALSYEEMAIGGLANLAQLIWHFFDGYQAAVKENFSQSEYFLKYTVLKENYEWVFYKSKRTERWWVEVSKNNTNGVKTLIPCTLDDYDSAMSGEVPESWFKYLSKIN